MKILDIGCGKNKLKPLSSRDEVVGLDFYDVSQADVKHDLNKFPYPFKDNTFGMIQASHVLEHLDDVVGVMNEIYRISKPGAKVFIKAPHFSSYTVWVNPTHKRGFTASTFNYFECGSSEKYSSRFFKVVKRRLNWAGGMRSENAIIKILNAVLNSVANASIPFCERFWCYYVGGFGEIEFELEVEK